MDWRPFGHLDHSDYDILVVWDYRDLAYNWHPLLRYEEICLIAWSMGVFVASISIHEIEPRVTMRVAINGTLTPIDDTRGIPPAIWRGTMNALSPGTWRKFKRRMCDSAEQYEKFAENAPKRTIPDLTEELEALETHTLFHTGQITDWDLAIVSRHDGIFPPANQLRAWRDVAPTRTLEAGHLPDFNQIINRLVISKNHVGERFGRAKISYHDAARVQHHIADKLYGYFKEIHGKDTPIIGNIIEIGPGADGALTRHWYADADLRARLRLWDLTPGDYSAIAPEAEVEDCDAEIRIRRQPSASAAFIFSSSTIQWFNSVRGFIAEASRVLVPGGYLILSSFIHGNMEELTSLIGNGLQLHPMAQWRKMFPPQMEILLCRQETEQLVFQTPRLLLKHLSDSGVNAIKYDKSGATLARHLLHSLVPDAETGQYTLTYRPIYIIARKIEE